MCLHKLGDGKHAVTSLAYSLNGNRQSTVSIQLDVWRKPNWFILLEIIPSLAKDSPQGHRSRAGQQELAG
jgi:hypothetical protein